MSPTKGDGYVTSDGRAVPSVSQVLKGCGWGIDSLLAWANSEGFRRNKHTDIEKRASNVGTIVHQMINDYLSGATFDPTPYRDADIRAALIPFDQFVAWDYDHSITAYAMEQHMVSDQYGYGGTPDIYGSVRGVDMIIDIKTSKRVYEKHILQLAAYRQLVRETQGVTVDHGLILNVTKDGAVDYRLALGDELDVAFDAFLGLLLMHNAYDLMSTVAGTPGRWFPAS